MGWTTMQDQRADPIYARVRRVCWGRPFFTASTTNFAISFAADPIKTSTFDHPPSSISPSRLHCDALQHDQQNSTSALHRK